LSGSSGGKSEQASNVPRGGKIDFHELKRLREAEKTSQKKVSDAETTYESMINEAEIEGQKLYESELNRIRTELEENYIIEEQRVNKEIKEIVAEGKEKAEDIRTRGEARIDRAVEAVMKKILEGG